MSDLTRPEAIDPNTLMLPVPAEVNLQDHLKWAIHMAKQAAAQTGHAILIYLEEKNAQPHYKFLRTPLEKLLDEATHPCPRSADFEFYRETGVVRQMPSALVYPNQEVVVSKPALCEGCAHYLSRAVRGHCQGLAYEPVKETR